MGIYPECGQTWRTVHKWRHGWKFRSLNGHGFAFGPILFLK